MSFQEQRAITLLGDRVPEVVVATERGAWGDRKCQKSAFGNQASAFSSQQLALAISMWTFRSEHPPLKQWGFYRSPLRG